jgi:diadenosine tetraphosphate (Ap4A) HIT family hydrolase
MVLTRLTTLFSFLPPCKGVSATNEVQAYYHKPPPEVNYSSNPTVFGRILEGSTPCAPIKESPTYFAFHDHRPAASLHGLVIPKHYVISLDSLSKKEEDLVILLELQEMGLEVVRKLSPEAYEKKDFKLCFHVPPFISVGHLHLHVLAPASEMNFAFKLKFWAGSRWCTDIEDVLAQWTKEEILMARQSITLLN